jgi:His-Xaa-Ser system protein HxsD
MIEERLNFDGAAYSSDAIQRAAYRFSDRLSLDLTRANGNFVCTLRLKDEIADQADEVLSDFRTEVLDQVLRERIRTETEGIRNLILSVAFSHTGLAPADE